jgi:dihydroxyacid dehydratase/phosphogluconate dehydratase
VDTIAPDALYDHMIASQTLRIAIVISGQGPEAFGMPEMAVPSFRINYNRVLRQIVSLITDGRYSGTNFGASVGHVTPEAIRGGGIGLLKTGDLLHLRFRAGRIDLIDPVLFAQEGRVELFQQDLREERGPLWLERKARLEKRALKIAPSNRMIHHTDAAHGVVPQQVADWATVRREVRANTATEMESAVSP